MTTFSLFVYEEVSVSESVESLLIIIGAGEYSVTFEEYKRALGPLALERSDEEIRHLFALSDQLAGVLFDMWRDKMNNAVE